MTLNRTFATILVATIMSLMWVILNGSFYVWDFAFGGLVGAAAWRLTPRPVRPNLEENDVGYKIPKVWKLIRFGWLFIYYILQANVQMTVAIVRSVRNFNHLKPAIVRVPTVLTRASEITLLANWITLTPGTLTIEVTPDGSDLFIHTYHLGESREAFIESILVLERHVQELFA